MTKKLNFPRLRFKKDDGTDFPAWEQRKLDDLAYYKKGPFGSALKKDIFISKGKGAVKVYEQQNAINKSWKLERYFISAEYAQELSSFQVCPGDIIVSCAGTIGEIYELPSGAEKGIINQALMRIKVKERINKSLFKIILSSALLALAKEKSNGSAIKNIPPFSDLKSAMVTVPKSENEQKKISYFFEQINNVITLHQKKLEHLKKLKKSLLQNMFPREGEIFPRLRFPEFTDAWEQRKFGELVRRISGAALSSPEKPGVEYEDINSGEGTLNKDIRLKVGAKKGQPFEPADLLYGKLRPYLKNILLPDFSGVAIGDFWVLRPARYSSTFLFNLIQTPRFEEKANCSAGSKMPRADWKLVSNSIFAVPKDPREAEKIGELFLSLNSTITLHQRKLEKMQLLKKALLQQMFV